MFSGFFPYSIQGLSFPRKVSVACCLFYFSHFAHFVVLVIPQKPVLSYFRGTDKTAKKISNKIQATFYLNKDNEDNDNDNNNVDNDNNK